MFAAFRPSVRSVILGSLALMMVLSLIYSTSIQYGHADVPVARSAAEIQPLGVGDQAPRFTVATVDNERFEFERPRETGCIDFFPRWLVPVLQYAFVGVASCHSGNPRHGHRCVVPQR